jgi:prepilin-type N-terminal cleavage/methylation domain-containing protein
VNSTKPSRAGQRGMTLIEAMAAAVIFSVGALSLVMLLTYAANINQQSRQISVANMLARNKLEQLTNLKYDSIGVGAEATNIDALGKAVPGSPLGKIDGNFDRRWTVELSPFGPNLVMKQITVTVRWYDRNTAVQSAGATWGKWRSVSLVGAVVQP